MSLSATSTRLVCNCVSKDWVTGNRAGAAFAAMPPVMSSSVPQQQAWQTSWGHYEVNLGVSISLPQHIKDSVAFLWSVSENPAVLCPLVRVALTWGGVSIRDGGKDFLLFSFSFLKCHIFLSLLFFFPHFPKPCTSDVNCFWCQNLKLFICCAFETSHFCVSEGTVKLLATSAACTGNDA